LTTVLISPDAAPRVDPVHARGLSAHARSVASLAGRVCRLLGLDERETVRVERAALLHDIGKLAIPRAILDKPGPLDDGEWALVRRHPVLGEAVVRALSPDAGVARMVRHHHERWDGAGYPDALAGDDIPLGARVIAACDTFDAITSERAYRPARRTLAALGEVARGSGTQLDPAVAAALVMAVGHA
jgi:putative nucleotidyltransferase with HDIG domain